MAWNTPSVPAAGTLINTTIWTAQIYDNFNYLKGIGGGAIVLQGNIQCWDVANVSGSLAAQAGVVDAVGPLAALSVWRRTITTIPASPVAGDRWLVFNPDGTFQFWTSINGTIMTLTTTGRCGINVAPSNTLHLSSGAGVALRVDGSGNAPLSTSASGGTPAAFYLGSANTYYLANPARWWLVVLDGTTYRIPCYTA